MSLAKYTAESEAVSSILFAHAADEELKDLVLPCLQDFRELSIAESGGEALELYHAKLPCMVVAALDLGDMTVFELCDRIRAVAPEAYIVLVGRERGELVYRRAMEAGGARYVVMDESAAAVLKAVVHEKLSQCEAQRATRQKVAAYRLQADALQALPLPVALLLAGGELLCVNQAFRNSAGFTEDDECPVALSTALTAIPATEPETGWSGLLAASAEGRAWSGTVICRGRNGVRIFFQVSMGSICAAQTGSEHVQLLVLNDITAHEEVRSHLSIQRDSAFEILESVQGASEIAETKSLSQLLSTETLPGPHLFSLRALISSVVASVSEWSKDRGNDILTTVPSYLPDLFLGRQNAVGRVVSCLLGNSLENCEGGRIQLKVDLKGKNSCGTLIQFAIGFNSSRVAANCFESMQDYLAGLNRMEDAQRPRRTGLSLAAALVEKMGGTTWVKSMMNHGCTYHFSLCFPEAPAADAATFTVSPERDIQPEQSSGTGFGFIDSMGAAATARPRILLADDNEVDQLTICRLLENMDYEVIRVANGREAVEEFDTSSCDAVLMDILMPEMDGFEATRMIREKERLVGSGHIPIIALTSYSLKAINEKCVSVGMDNYLHKPVSAQNLAKLFASILPVAHSTDMQEMSGFPLLDVKDTLNSLGGDIDLYREIVGLFIVNIPSAHQDLVAAIRSGAPTAVLQCAHKIRGMSANVGAKRYAELVRQIEDVALQGNLGNPSQWLNSLATEFPQLQSAVAAIAWHELQ